MEWDVGDVIQIMPDADEIFGGCFFVAQEIKTWGAQGYVEIPQEDQGVAYYRLEYCKGVKIGRAEWFLQPSKD